MDKQSLFSLIGERILMYSTDLNVKTYNALYEILVEDPCTQVLHRPHPEPTASTVISNPGKRYPYPQCDTLLFKKKV